MSEIPNHIAIIPDGNRRWATANGLNAWQGHQEGAKRFEEVAEAAFEAGVKHVTFWGASIDNLKKRSPLEVSVLFKLLVKLLEKEIKFKRLLKNKVQFKLLGKYKEFSPDTTLYQLAKTVEEAGKDFQEHIVTILFGYDGKTEMLEAIEKIKAEQLPVDEASVQKNLLTKDLPAVDLVIRTGGEPHWSAGFLMWQTQNSQFYFTEKLWPDFTPKELNLALADYASRERRLGK
jgi:undecaprenyl diphosphate synthase